MGPILILKKPKFLALFVTLFAMFNFASAQTKPYSNGTYYFGVFDKEYQKTTARCEVIIKNDWAIVKVTEPLLKDVYYENEIIYNGRITKYNGQYYIVENGGGAGQVDDFEYETPRIDFNRKYVIHY
jgi:hypothetical protein